MSKGPSDDQEQDHDPRRVGRTWHGDGHACPEDDDAAPHRGRVVLVAVLVPVVGAAGGAAGSLFRGSASTAVPLLLLAAVVAFFLCFALFSLSTVWLLDRASVAVARVRAVRERRDGAGPRGR
ncbi:hypothetical protein [Streptomyces lavendofoliae]|uniref:Uncharacterized protein n=1 Tax=Streptomyces lavendofoliae TaxID=67314 RepID=A0A918M7I6_9ACTN|nr:hypothetical protein [Streptomyces lavendofoliae]GGU59043.1 hypothetical protein GCM10010274_54960 [Streptomyces lavendofoliae]